ncbi:copper-exporting P-type ATPase A [mine drainage metagenome]|uniref:Copper-exporting P-type ATPase A n=1 Tax=mine drainage metagenome TaxID=410659 RepID=A0A1J5Q1J5_9ZZZZ
MADSCYHCGLPVPADSRYRVRILGEPRDLCCHGCQAVAESIVANGLEDYYRYRTELPKTADELVPDELRRLDLYDHPEVQKSFVAPADGHLRQASLILEGITCAACIWLNERHLKQLPGVVEVSVNYASHRARVTWDESRIKLSTILVEIRKLGYQAHPFNAQQQEALRQQRRRLDIRRLAVAGICTGQVMMLGVALYAGAATGMDMATEQLMRWFSLLLTVPAVIYAAMPFYRSAWRALLRGQLGMDLPITLGILIGFGGSVWATVQGAGVVYYDTITMLIFFLLSTRFMEQGAREKSVEAAENLLRLVPAMATRLDTEGQQVLVPVHELSPGELILSRPGETIAADGVVEQGDSHADESLLTGESRPLPKTVGERVFAGSVNFESPLLIRVSNVGEETVLAGIVRLLDRAQAQKPRLAQVADRVAAYFTYALLFLVVLVALAWWYIDAARAFEITLAVLVVSCPCALSLAAPAVFAAAGSHLVRRGVLLTRGHALETLARATHFVFDKTGTLTLGRPVLLQTLALSDLPAQDCLLLAASLEQASEHPLARSFLQATQHRSLPAVSSSENVPGQGVAGVVGGRRYSLGNAALTPGLAATLQPDAELPLGATVVWLCDDATVLAAFVLADTLRPQAREMVAGLKQRGIHVSIMSGDSLDAVACQAGELGVDDWQAGLLPQQKLAALRALQAQGAVVAMVGDGINDAPVLAGAQVSIAMGSGTQMARTTGDVVLLTENLLEIDHAVATSRFGLQVIRQNFAWALGYNLLVVPFAATGHISPWLAALGMSMSSLVVVLNALRLR